ncbi:fibronectin type III domain-containing protein [Candidatus Dojkabacteria bacterium]|nr:fibronectin type III domain-containing protein [Candidatus Dojkabacteria bacterium]
MSSSLNKPKLQLRPIWQIILAVFILISIPLTVFILQGQIDFRSGASPTENPTEVVVSNLNNTSATISFETKGQKTRSILNYGESENSLTNSSFDERRKYDPNISDLFKLHYHKLINLKPETDYFFSISVGDKIYTSANYKFKTLATSSLQVPMPINGTVEGGPFEEGIIYVHMKSDTERSSIISELLPTSGNFTASLGGAVDKAGNSFITGFPNPSIYIFSNVSDKGKGATKITKDTTDIKISTSTQAEEYNPEKIEAKLNENGTGTPTESVSITKTPTPLTTPGNPTEIDNTSKLLLYDSYDIAGSNFSTPKNISISNPSSTSFTVSWTTIKPYKGAIAFGINGTPNTLTYDKRDTATSQTQRYTHIVDVINSNFKVGDIISFLILSEGTEYINENEYFKYRVPSIQQAPSPQSIEMKILPNFSPTIANKDFIILAKTSNSSWISSTINGDSNTSLPIGIFLNRNLDSSINLNENDNIELLVYGEGNSFIKQDNKYQKDGIIEIKPEKGIILINIESEAQLKAGDKISGTSKPNSEITIKIGSSLSTSINSDASGNWSYSIPRNAPTGNQQITISDNNIEIPFEITIQGENAAVSPTPRPQSTATKSTTPKPSATDDLAETAIDSEYIEYIYGFTILIIGLYLFRISTGKETRPL